MCLGTVSSSVFRLIVLLVTNLKSRNGKTSNAPEVLTAADIFIKFQVCMAWIVQFLFFLSFRVCTSHPFDSAVDRFVFRFVSPISCSVFVLVQSRVLSSTPRF
jgi:hypothetical protein